MRKDHAATTSAPRRAKLRTPAIDFDRYIPVVVGSFMNKLRNSSTIFFRERFDITILEWRVLSFLAAEGPSSAYQIWNAMALDKAAVSRGLKSLARKRLVIIRTDRGDSRRRMIIELTGEGRALQAATVDIILERHRRLVAGLDEAELDALVRMIKHLETRIPAMGLADEQPAPATAKSAARKRAS